MCWKHQTESADTWMSVWIDPIFKVLSGSDKQQINNVIEVRMGDQGLGS